MRVLLIEGQEGAAHVARDALVACGHDVTTCHREGQPSFPCKGLDATGCPLDAEPVDVAVLARSAASAHQLPSEVGVSCALRRHIPLVSIGDDERSPYAEHVHEHVASADELVDTVARVARAPLAPHSAAACDALRRVLDRHGRPDIGATGCVERRGGALRVQLTTSTPIPLAWREQASVSALGAVRTVDHDAEIISVGVEHQR